MTHHGAYSTKIPSTPRTGNKLRKIIVKLNGTQDTWEIEDCKHVCIVLQGGPQIEELMA